MTEYSEPAYIPEGDIQHTNPGSNHIEMMEMLSAIFIQLSRIYDCQMAGVSDGYRQEMDKTHESGGLLASPPMLREDAWDVEATTE